jgi:hypothetical protein
MTSFFTGRVTGSADPVTGVTDNHSAVGWWPQGL